MFLGFSEDFDKEEGLYCGTLIDCFLTVTIFGLEQGGFRESLGAGTQPDGSETYVPNQHGRVFVDLAFWILLTVIMMNLVLGVIVDTFSQLREEQATRESEQLNKCYMCSNATYEFEKQPGGFTKHKEKEHNMWMYIYAALYIKELDDGDRSYHQHYLHDHFNSKKPSQAPFPILRALGLERAGGSKQDDALKSLLKKVSSVETKSDQVT